MILSLRKSFGNWPWNSFSQHELFSFTGPTGSGKSQVCHPWRSKLRTVSTNLEYSSKRSSIHSPANRGSGPKRASSPSLKISRLLVFWTMNNTDHVSFLSTHLDLTTRVGATRKFSSWLGTGWKKRISNLTFKSHTTLITTSAQIWETSITIGDRVCPPNHRSAHVCNTSPQSPHVRRTYWLQRYKECSPCHHDVG